MLDGSGLSCRGVPAVLSARLRSQPESRWLVGEVVELPGCYTQAPDLPSLEANIQETIRAFLGAVSPEEPLPDFVGTWRVEVAA